MRAPVRDICPHYRWKSTVWLIFIGCIVVHHKDNAFSPRLSCTSCHVSNTDWQGGGRNTEEVTTPKSPPGHQGVLWGSLKCIKQSPCGTMRGPEPEAELEAGWDWYGDPGDPAHRGLSLPDFHPQLPNSILLCFRHQPITRLILSIVLFIMEELSSA